MIHPDIALIEANTRKEVMEEVKEIVASEMDKTEHLTNQEFIACDDLAIKIIKKLSDLQKALKEE